MRGNNLNMQPNKKTKKKTVSENKIKVINIKMQKNFIRNYK